MIHGVVLAASFLVLYVLRLFGFDFFSAPFAARTGSKALDAANPALWWLQRCNIKRQPWPEDNEMLSTSETEPYIVDVPSGRNAKVSIMTTRGRLLADMGDMNCTPTATGNNRQGGIHHMRMREYIEDWMTREVQQDPSSNRYVFGEFGHEWAPYRDAYVLPPCQECTRERVAITLGLGGLHTGAPWHFHEAAFLEVLHGRKHFALLPKSDPAVPLIDESIKNNSQLHWYLEQRPGFERNLYLQNLQECTMHPGELLFFPNMWHHGVLNLDEWTAFVSTFL